MDTLKYFCLIALGLMTVETALAGGSHSYINSMRSSSVTHVFMSQTVEGEFGSFETNGRRSELEDNEDGKSFTDAQDWKGYGLGTSFGLEIMKFVQFSAGHTFVNLVNKNDRSESLRGSRMNAGLNLVFTAPLANLEFGTGLIGSRLDYQKQLEYGSFYGSGFYQSLGLNYFMSQKISLTFHGKYHKERLNRNGGSAEVKDMNTNMTVMGFGLRIWI